MEQSIKNAKIAVCFYGFLRSFKHTHLSLMENLIKPHKADVFMCTHNTFYSDITKDPWHSKHNPEPVSIEYLQGVFGERFKGCEIYPYDPEPYKQEVLKYKMPQQNFMDAYIFRNFAMMDLIRKVIGI